MELADKTEALEYWRKRAHALSAALAQRDVLLKAAKEALEDFGHGAKDWTEEEEDRLIFVNQKEAINYDHWPILPHQLREARDLAAKIDAALEDKNNT